jgi:hypothetical protein
VANLILQLARPDDDRKLDNQLVAGVNRSFRPEPGEDVVDGRFGEIFRWAFLKRHDGLGELGSYGVVSCRLPGASRCGFLLNSFLLMTDVLLAA